jgi:4-aminobutyrate aminotransferase-like enzyme
MTQPSAWRPSRVARRRPPIVMPDEVAEKTMDIVEEAIGEVERMLGYA